MIKTNLPIDIDDTLAANSDIRIASQKAVKSYVDNRPTSGFSGDVTISTDAPSGGADGDLWFKYIA